MNRIKKIYWYTEDSRTRCSGVALTRLQRSYHVKPQQIYCHPHPARMCNRSKAPLELTFTLSFGRGVKHALDPVWILCLVMSKYFDAIFQISVNYVVMIQTIITYATSQHYRGGYRVRSKHAQGGISYCRYGTGAFCPRWVRCDTRGFGIREIKTCGIPQRGVLLL